VLEYEVCLCECGCRVKPMEQLASVLENRYSLVDSAKVDQAAAVALHGKGVFRDHAELLPALGGVGVAGRGGLVVAACFGEDGGGGYEGMLGVGVARFEADHETGC